MPKIGMTDGLGFEPLQRVTVRNAVLIHNNCLLEIGSLDWHSIDVVITDPPYGISYKTNWNLDAKDCVPEVIPGDGCLTTMKDSLGLLVGKMKSTSALYMFCSQKNIDEVIPLVKGVGLRTKNILIWDKGRSTAGDLGGDYGHCYEMIIYAVKRSHKLRRRLGNVFRIPGVSPFKMTHPNQKPASLLKKLIRQSSIRGDLVVDPFGGSFSTAEAAIRLGRKFWGCEISQKHFDDSVARLKSRYSVDVEKPSQNLGGFDAAQIVD